MGYVMKATLRPMSMSVYCGPIPKTRSPRGRRGRNLQTAAGFAKTWFRQAFILTP